jgi:hypothetical protein
VTAAQLRHDHFDSLNAPQCAVGYATGVIAASYIKSVVDRIVVDGSCDPDHWGKGNPGTGNRRN